MTGDSTEKATCRENEKDMSLIHLRRERNQVRSFGRGSIQGFDEVVHVSPYIVGFSRSLMLMCLRSKRQKSKVRLSSTKCPFVYTEVVLQPRVVDICPSKFCRYWIWRFHVNVKSRRCVLGWIEHHSLVPLKRQTEIMILFCPVKRC